jgi:hypothetical protein
MPGLTWTTIFEFILLTIAGMIGVNHHAQFLLVEMGSHELFACIGLRSSISLPPE